MIRSARWIGVLGLALAAVAVSCGRDGDPDPVAKPAPVEPTPAPVASAPAAPRHEEPSIYDLDLALHAHHGQSVPLHLYRGHPVLITMFYGSCTTACPVLVEEVRKIERALPAERRANLRVLLVSFDAARDTPARLLALATDRNLDLARWTLAAAAEDDARQLAAVLGIKYRRIEGGDFAHSSVISLLDRDGRPMARLDGLGADNAAIIAAIQ